MSTRLFISYIKKCKELEIAPSVEGLKLWKSVWKDIKEYKQI